MNQFLLPLAGRLARGWDRLRQSTKRRIGLISPPIILAYRGYWSGGHAVFSGRVIEDEKVIGAEPTDSRWKNLWRTFRRYETDEIRKARVVWRMAGQEGVLETDSQGFFHLDQAINQHEEGPWAFADLLLESAPGYDFEPRRTICGLRVTSSKARLGVISDVDDTIIQTRAQNLFAHWRTVSLNSAEGRIAFPGVSFFFRALASGFDGPETNPIFYVSSSPWNLYDLFEDFMGLCDFPKGPIFLKDFGIDKTQWLTGSHRKHKLAAIKRIITAHPALSFVLIGDTGQSDAVIYAQAVEDYPGRILSVHLRDVSPRGLKPRVQRAVTAIEAAGIPVTVSASLQEAAEVVQQLGLVASGTSAELQAAIEADRQRLAEWTGPMPFRDDITHGGQETP